MIGRKELHRLSVSGALPQDEHKMAFRFCNHLCVLPSCNWTCDKKRWAMSGEIDAKEGVIGRSISSCFSPFMRRGLRFFYASLFISISSVILSRATPALHDLPSKSSAVRIPGDPSWQPTSLRVRCHPPRSENQCAGKQCRDRRLTLREHSGLNPARKSASPHGC